MTEITPYNNLSSFIAFRSDEDRNVYEDVHNFNKNWFDRASNPEFIEYEQTILDFVKGLHNDYFEWGFLTVDSSEAIFCALLIHLLNSGKRSGVSRPNFVISKLGHTSYKKAAVLLGVELREVEVLGSGEVNLTNLEEKIDSETFAVIGVAGTTTLGNYDNIIELDKLCAKHGVLLHIDAAIGGFIYPFNTNEKIPSDFQMCRSLVSLNISGHKYGYSRPSVAILLLKNENILPKEFYSSSIPYLQRQDTEEFGLLGSKSPIGLIDLNYNVVTWGKSGYAQIVSAALAQKKRLTTEFQKFDGIEIIDSGDTPIFLISGNEVLLKKLSKQLGESGWFSGVTEVNDRASIRIVVRRHFDDDYVTGLIRAAQDFFIIAEGKL